MTAFSNSKTHIPLYLALIDHLDGIVQERRNSSALAME